jgi:hypothetical protein
MKKITSLACILLIAFSSRLFAQRFISFRATDGLAVSTGNLYFTSHDAAGAAVWRTSQGSVPGQETILYWEAGARFGDIVFAKVGNAFFGYFFVQQAGNVVIKRVSLTGGTATFIATVGNDIDIANSHHNLVTDGVNLYWQDVNSIRKVSINGGAITKLDACRDNTPTAGIDLQNSNVIYADVTTIRFVPTAGAITAPNLRVIAEAGSRVSSLHVEGSAVFWGEQSGAVRKKVGNVIQNLQSSGFLATSIGSNGSRTAWTQCASTSCQLKKFPGSTISIANNAMGIFMTLANVIFWGDATGVHTMAF